MVTATPDLDLDLTVLDELDLDIPCDVIATRTRAKCDEPAEWILSLRRHCRPDVIEDRLVCDKHWRAAVSGLATSWCATCGVHGLTVLDYIVRSERLKP